MTPDELPPATLPVLDPADPCRGCGACCRHMVMPPFVPDFHVPENRNEEFDAFKRGWPGLAAELESEYGRKMREGDWPEEAPCFWYDAATNRCKHYDARPEVCRDFEPGTEACLAHRGRWGIGTPGTTPVLRGEPADGPPPRGRRPGGGGR